MGKCVAIWALRFWKFTSDLRFLHLRELSKIQLKQVCSQKVDFFQFGVTYKFCKHVLTSTLTQGLQPYIYISRSWVKALVQALRIKKGAGNSYVCCQQSLWSLSLSLSTLSMSLSVSLWKSLSLSLLLSLSLSPSLSFYSVSITRKGKHWRIFPNSIARSLYIYICMLWSY